MHPLFVFAVTIETETLKQLQFRSEGFSFVAQWIVFGLLTVVLGGVAVLVYMMIRRSRQQEEFNRMREEARIRLLLNEFNLTGADQELFEIFTHSKSPGRYIPLLESRRVFEDAIREFRAEEPAHPALAQVAKLRHRLGYGIANVRNPFEDTRMLSVGTKLQCRIPQVKRDITFVTTVIGTNEDYFLVRAPHSQGKPVGIGEAATLSFKVGREDDAEYEFVGRVLRQNKDSVGTIALEHTNEIQKMMFRNAPRRAVELETRFFVVKQEVAQARGHGNFRASESQFAFQGHLRDLSVGGSLLVTPVSPQNPAVGDLVVFRLPPAQINEDLVAEVVRHTPLPGELLQIHLRFSGMKEINRLKINRYLQTMEEKAPPKEQGPVSNAAS